MNDVLLLGRAPVGEDDLSILELHPIGAAVLDDVTDFLARSLEYAHLNNSPY